MKNLSAVHHKQNKDLRSHNFSSDLLGTFLLTRIMKSFSAKHAQNWPLILFPSGKTLQFTMRLILLTKFTGNAIYVAVINVRNSNFTYVDNK